MTARACWRCAAVATDAGSLSCRRRAAGETGGNGGGCGGGAQRRRTLLRYAERGKGPLTPVIEPRTAVLLHLAIVLEVFPLAAGRTEAGSGDAPHLYGAASALAAARAVELRHSAASI